MQKYGIMKSRFLISIINRPLGATGIGTSIGLKREEDFYLLHYVPSSNSLNWLHSHGLSTDGSENQNGALGC